MDFLPPQLEQLTLPPAAAALFYWLSVAGFGLAGGGFALAAASRPRGAARPDAAAGRGMLTSLGESVVRLLRWQPARHGRVERWQAWCALTGKPLSLPLLWGMSCSLGLAGLALGSVLGPVAAVLLAGLAGAAYPLVIANRVAGLEAEFVRSLPTTIILIMAEHKAGGSIEGALDRLSERPGLISHFFADTLARTRQDNSEDPVPLFSRDEQTGTLARRARALRLPELQHLIETLETVAAQGPAADQVLSRLNDMQVIELTKRGRDRINALSQRLVIVIAAFFLLPIMGLLLFGLFTPLIGTIGSF